MAMNDGNRDEATNLAINCAETTRYVTLVTLTFWDDDENGINKWLAEGNEAARIFSRTLKAKNISKLRLCQKTHGYLYLWNMDNNEKRKHKSGNMGTYNTEKDICGMKSEGE